LFNRVRYLKAKIIKKKEIKIPQEEKKRKPEKKEQKNILIKEKR